MLPIKHSNFDQLVKEHFHHIKDHLTHRSKNVSFKQIDNWFRTNGSRISFEEVICADLEELDEIRSAYHDPNQNYPIEILLIRDNLYTYYFSSTKYLGSGSYNAWELIKQLDVSVCPYCNRHFINNIESKQGANKRTSQIDHFYDKNAYPYLAMSFYNLVPSCPSCNLLKGEKTISYNPYDCRYEGSDLFDFKIKINSVAYLYDKNFDIELEVKEEDIRSNIKIFELESQYALHKDIVTEQLIKERIYTKERIIELRDNFPDLLYDENLIRRILFGNYIDQDNLHKRPLSKLMKDIINII